MRQSPELFADLLKGSQAKSPAMKIIPYVWAWKAQGPSVARGKLAYAPANDSRNFRRRSPHEAITRVLSLMRNCRLSTVNRGMMVLRASTMT